MSVKTVGSGVRVVIVSDSAASRQGSTMWGWLRVEPASRTRPPSRWTTSHGNSTTRSSQPAPYPAGRRLPLSNNDIIAGSDSAASTSALWRG